MTKSVRECRRAREKRPKTYLVDLALAVDSAWGEGCFSDDDLNINVSRGRRGIEAIEKQVMN